MKQLLLTITLVICVLFTKAQSLAINNSGAVANSSAILDVSSTTKGLLVPRMLATQRIAIATPATGLLVYDTDSASFAYYSAGAWIFLTGNISLNSNWATTGNAATNESVHFLGTTDNKNLIFKRNNIRAGLLDVSNTSFGVDALKPVSSGINNTAIGVKTLFSNTTGAKNTALGFEALYSNTVGNNNVAIGDSALRNNGIGASSTQGINNTAVGSKAMAANTTGYRNTALGFGALKNNGYANNTIAIGDSAMYYSQNGYQNIAIGNNALLYSNDLSFANVAIGMYAMQNNALASKNIAIGNKSQYNTVSGYENIAMGYESMYSNTSSTDNLAIGTESLYSNISGSQNTALGNSALYSNSTGYGNIAIGLATMFTHKKNDLNVAIGWNTYQSDTSGKYNTVIGGLAAQSNDTGVNNTIIGYEGMRFSKQMNYNTMIGSSSSSLSTTTNYSNSLGYLTRIEGNNSTAIGTYAKVTADNSMVLGGINGVNSATVDTKVGIGVTNPSEKLEIGNGRLRFKGFLTSGFAHGITWTDNAGTTDKAFLGMETDNYFGLYQWGLGAWNVRFHNTSGEMGVNVQPLTTNNDARLQVKQATSQNGIGIIRAGGTQHWDMFLDNNTTPDFNFYLNGSTLKGYIRNSDGVYIVVSDRRLKQNITPLNNVLPSLLQLTPSRYQFIDSSNATPPYTIGFIAQDVQKLFPEAVDEKMLKNGKPQLGINYQYFSVLSIKAIQEQQHEIEALKKENIEVKNILTQLKEQINLLKTKQ